MKSAETGHARAGKLKVRSVFPCLTFSGRAEEAVNFYVSLFPDSRIVNIVRSETDGPIPRGKVINASFILMGQEYTAFDGGDHFRFNDAFSLFAMCDTQEELDAIWDALAEGGEPIQCGWITDRFGVSWQIVPAGALEILSHPERGNIEKYWDALMKMVKLDIATLEKAFHS